MEVVSVPRSHPEWNYRSGTDNGLETLPLRTAEGKPSELKLRSGTDHDLETLPFRTAEDKPKLQVFNRGVGHGLWQSAFDRLPGEVRNELIVSPDIGLDTVTKLFEEASAKQKLYRNHEIKIEGINGNRVSLRQILTNTMSSISKFLEILDLTAQVDPVHVGLPWAAFRLLFTAALNDVEAQKTMQDSLGTIAHKIYRYSFCDFLFEPIETKLTRELREALLRLYMKILECIYMLIIFYKDPDNRGRRFLKVFKNMSGLGPDRALKHHLESMTQDENDVKLYADLASEQFRRTQTAEIKESIQLLYSCNQNTVQGILTAIQDLGEPLNFLLGGMKEIPSHIARTKRKEIATWLGSTQRSEGLHAKIRDERLQGSGEWIFATTEFQQWRNSRRDRVLWLHGTPGSGKTFMTWALIDHMQRQSPRLAFVYCNPGADPYDILSAILKQVSGAASFQTEIKQPVASKWIELSKSSLEPRKLTSTECVDLICELDSESETTIVIDAIDECGNKWNFLCSKLRDIVQNSANTNIFVSSREHCAVGDYLKNPLSINSRTAGSQNDINQFIRVATKQLVEEMKMFRISAELENRIIQLIELKAQGMFQWVRLYVTWLKSAWNEGEMMEKLNSTKMKSDLIGAAKTLQTTYDDLYREIIANGSEIRAKIATNAFTWLLCTRSSLTASQFIAAVTEDDIYEQADDVKDERIRGILLACANFVVFNTEAQTFGFSHLSVREYLEQRPEFAVGNNHNRIGEKCLELLMSGDRRHSPDQAHSTVTNPLLVYASLHWASHVSSIQGTLYSDHLVSKLKHFLSMLHGATAPFQAWADSLESLSDESPNIPENQTQMLRSCMTSPCDPIFTSCIFGFTSILTRRVSKKGFNPNMENSKGESLICLACLYGHFDIVKLLLECPNSDLIQFGSPTTCRTSKEGSTASRTISKCPDIPLVAAAKGGREDVVRYLLDRAIDIDVVCSSGCHGTALQEACSHGHNKVVELLLLGTDELEPLDLNLADSQGRTALHLASAHGHLEIVQRLCMHHASFSWDKSGRSPIDCAQQNSHIKVANYLTKQTLDLHSDSQYGALLETAVREGDHRTVSTLLTRNADLTKYPNLLHLAATCSNFSIIRKLVDQGADLNLPSSTSDKQATALHYVSADGNLEAVDLLCKLGAKLVHDKERSSPFHYASYKGRTRVLLRLLEANHTQSDPIDVDEQNDSKGFTPLLVSCREGHPESVKVLLQTGKTNVKALTPRRKTALILAAISGQSESIRLILSAAGDDKEFVNHRDEEGQTALFFAAWHCDVDCIQALLDHGADVRITHNDRRTVLHHATLARRPENVKRFLQIPEVREMMDNRNLAGYAALHDAAQHSVPEVLPILLEADAPDVPNSAGKFAIHVAAWSIQNTRCIEILLQDDPERLHQLDDRGALPVHHAAQNKRTPDVLNYLLEAARQSNCLDRMLHAKSSVSGSTPLHCAASNCNLPAIRLLMSPDWKVDVTVRDDAGETALNYALLAQNAECSMQLMEDDREQLRLGHIAYGGDLARQVWTKVFGNSPQSFDVRRHVSAWKDGVRWCTFRTQEKKTQQFMLFYSGQLLSGSGPISLPHFIQSPS